MAEDTVSGIGCLYVVVAFSGGAVIAEANRTHVALYAGAEAAVMIRPHTFSCIGFAFVLIGAFGFRTEQNSADGKVVDVCECEWRCAGSLTVDAEFGCTSLVAVHAEVAGIAEAEHGAGREFNNRSRS